MSLIGLTGPGGSGKDVIASYLVKNQGFKRVAFADKLKELAYELNPEIPELYDDLQGVVDNCGWDQGKELSPFNTLNSERYPVREYLQTLGVSMRTVFGEDFWIDQVGYLVEGHWLESNKNVVITDVRFPNELKYVQKTMAGEVWRVTGRSRASVVHSTHVSEQKLEGVDVQISNTAGFDYLYDQVEDALKTLGI